MSSKREHEPSSTPDPLGKRLKESPKLFENESAPSSLPIETQNHQNQVPSAVKPNSISKTTDTCLIQKPNATNSDSFTSSFPVISEQESESNDKTKHVKDETLKVEISKSNSTLKPYLTEVEVGVSEDKGTRHSMEDAWVMMEDYYVSESSKPVSNHSRFSFYAIFDGHGGRKAAIFAKNNMHKFVFKNNLSYEKVEHKKFRKEIVDGIKNLDSALLKESAAENWQDGAAIVCVWIIKQSVFIANLGDAKAILAKESNEQEKKNIKEKEKENEKKEEGEGEGENLLFFGIFSAPDHWNQRMGVRESWLKFDALKQGLANYKFFVGWSTNMTINLRLVEENLRYKDLIILPFIDHYFILTLKTLSLCLYAHYYLPRKSKFVMKADDDTFVRVDAIIAKLRPHVHDDSLYYGALVYNGQVDRNPKSKWFVSFQEWYPHTYPTWAHGPGYVISYSFAQRIVSEFNKGKLDYFKLEDISMSVWVSNLKNENTSFLDDGTLNFDGCRDNYTIAHYQNPQRMQCLWRKLSSDADASCCEHV